MRAQFITAEEVEQALGVSRSKAYQIIRALNKELKAMGYITIAGKCPMKELAPSIKDLEHYADKYSKNAEKVLPEAGTQESAKTYREKRAKKFVPDTAFKCFEGIDHGDMALFYPERMAQELQRL